MLCIELDPQNNNFGMKLLKNLKFGTLVVLLDPLKIFLMIIFDSLVIITESFLHTCTFPIGKP